MKALASRVKDLTFNLKCNANPLEGSKLRVKVEDKTNVLATAWKKIWWGEAYKNR